MAKPKDKQPWFKFFPANWRGNPELRLCSIGARGLWMEMLCLMHEAEPYGHLVNNGFPVSNKQLAALAGISLTDVMKFMCEMESAGVYSRTEDKVIYSRKMVRDKAKAEQAKADGTDGGNPYIRRGTVPKEQRSRPYKRTDAPQKTLRIFQKSAGKCHWCSVDLIFEPDGSKRGFHVDHVLPICDGGTNDENNLVASCADCNHKRARLNNPTGTPVSVGIDSDTNLRQEQSSKSINQAAAAEAALDENGLKQEAALKALFVSIRRSLGWSIPNLDQIKVWLAAGIPQGTISVAVTPILKRKEDMVSLAYCDSAVREAHAAAPVEAITSGQFREFVPIGTPEWNAWQMVSGPRGTPTRERRDADGRVQTGWDFPKRWPDGFDEATGERLAPSTQNEDAA